MKNNGLIMHESSIMHGFCHVEMAKHCSCLYTPFVLREIKKTLGPPFQCGGG